MPLARRSGRYMSPAAARINSDVAIPAPISTNPASSSGTDDVRVAAGTHAFDPVVIVAGLVPFVGMILVLMLVRNTRATQDGLLRPI